MRRAALSLVLGPVVMLGVVVFLLAFTVALIKQ
jgi:hypothetical protein